MLIKTQVQFNPFFRPVPLANSTVPVFKLPPDAFPITVPWDNAGVSHRFIDGIPALTPLVSFRFDAAGRDYYTTGMDACPSPIAPLYEITELVGYSYQIDYPHNYFVRSVINSTMVPPTGRNTTPEIVLNGEFPESVLGSVLYNITGKFYPRWQYPNGDIVEGSPTLFRISIASDTGIAADAVSTGTPQGTEIADLAFGIPYTSAETGGRLVDYDGSPPPHIPFIDELFGVKLSLSGLTGNLYPIGGARINGVWRDVYPASYSADQETFGTKRLVVVGYRLATVDEEINIANHGANAWAGGTPFQPIRATKIHDYWNVWKGDIHLAKPGAVGYIFHTDYALEMPGYKLNPPPGQIYLIYEHPWSLTP